jgi:rhamnulose-1-phosphate aldolase
MKDKILSCPKFNEYLNVIDQMYKLGWDERNGGNVSILMDEDEVNEYLAGGRKYIRDIPLPMVADPIVCDRVFIFTGTGKYFRNTKADPIHNIGIIRISEDGKTAHVLWGFEGGGKFTSEIFAHLMCHAAKLAVNPKNHVVMHCHPTNLLIMTHTHDLDEKSFTLDLWRAMSECIVVFPEGVAVLPWMLCGTDSIGRATAAKMKDYRVVIWALHGIYGAGETLDEVFGLVETIEKAAQLYLGYVGREKNTITDDDLKQLCALFHAVPHPGYLK